jgi:hypothetical protein
VNVQIAELGIRNITPHGKEADLSDVRADDVVIVPAFGVRSRRSRG